MNNKLTIGIFNDSFYPMIDGVYMVVDNYARRLLKYANVIVFVPDYKGNSYDDSIFPYKIVRCKSLKVLFQDYVLPIPNLDSKFKKELEKYKLDIVHIHSPFAIGKIGLKYAKKHHIPCVATMHSQFKKDFIKAFKSEYIATKLTNKFIKTYNECDMCWAVNSEVARIFHEEYHYKYFPKVMNNATEMKLVSDTEKAHDFINKKHNLNKDDIVFLFVGRINTLKNIFFIVDSLNLLKVKKPDLKWKMLFVGSGQDEEKLKKKISELNLDKEIIMCGKITDRKELAYYYNRAHLMLFPSKYDSSSIVQIEAASQKTPTIFLENTATAETVTNNVNGYLSKDSIKAYSDKIIEILENEKLYNEIKENAYRDLYKSWDSMIDDAYYLYKDLIEEKLKK